MKTIARRTTSRTAALALALCLASGPAFAQDEPNSADVGAARSLGQEGVKLADGGNCADAIDKFARAEKLFHAPTTLGRLGECQVQLGKIVDGTENLNRVVREALSPSAPQAFKDAQDRARKVLDTAKPKIAKLKIAVAASPDAVVTVKIDGVVVPPANLNMNRPTDPGEHTVEASAPGFLTTTQKVKLAEGGNDSVALTLDPDPNAPKVVAVTPVPGGSSTPPPTGGPATTQPPPDTTPPSSRVPAYIALGVGVAGLGVGTIFGLVASGKKGDLDKSCSTSKVCPSDQQSNIDSAKSSATISTVGFVVGGVALAAGAFLFLTSGGSNTKTANVTPYVGLGNGGVAGRF